MGVVDKTKPLLLCHELDYGISAHEFYFNQVYELIVTIHWLQ